MERITSSAVSATLSTGFTVGEFVSQLLIGRANNARERLYSCLNSRVATNTSASDLARLGYGS